MSFISPATVLEALEGRLLAAPGWEMEANLVVDGVFARELRAAPNVKNGQTPDRFETDEIRFRTEGSASSKSFQFSG